MTDAKIGGASYELGADLTPLKKGLAGAEKAIKQSGTTAETAFRKQAAGGIAEAEKRTQGLMGKLRTMSGSGGIVGSILGGVGLGVGLGAFNLIGQGLSAIGATLGDAQKAASAMAETQSKLDAVFVTSADTMRDWSADSARAMGLSQQAALEAAGTFGNFLQAMGTAEPAAADMSSALVQLAADLGSFNNQDPTAVLLALRSGLSGEAEPLRKYGVALSAATVDAELMAQGVQKVGGEFSEADKITARYDIILRQTARAQGDFGRTADGTANKQKTLNSLTDDAKAKLGVFADQVVNTAQGLAIDLVGGITAVIDALDDLQRFLSPHTAAIEDIDANIRSLAEAYGLAPEPVIAWAAAELESAKATEDAALAERLLMFEVEAYRASLMGLYDDQVKIDAETKVYEDALRGATEATQAVTSSVGDSAIAARDLLQRFNSLTLAEKLLWGQTGKLPEVLEPVGDAADDTGDDLADMAHQVDLAKGAFKSFWQSVNADQRQVRFFIRHPGKLRAELDHIESAIARSEKQKDKLEADGIQRRDVLALAAMDRRIEKLKARQTAFAALGLLYGNALEGGLETGFAPTITIATANAMRQRQREKGRADRRDDISRAHGGPVGPGAWLVNELGRETLLMGQGTRGYVLDHSKTAQLLSAASGRVDHSGTVTHRLELAPGTGRELRDAGLDEATVERVLERVLHEAGAHSSLRYR